MADDISVPVSVEFVSGAIRSALAAGEVCGELAARIELVSPIALRRLSQAYAEGAIKYPLDNWQKGIPESSLLSHAHNHLAAYMMDDKSEDHLAHACWNLFTLMHFQAQRPDLMDLEPIRKGNSNKVVIDPSRNIKDQASS